MVPICARAGDASAIAEAAKRAANPAKAMVLSILRGIRSATRAPGIRLKLIVQGYKIARRWPALRLTRRIRRGKGRSPSPDSQPAFQVEGRAEHEGF
jgi:hypothetical protein